MSKQIMTLWNRVYQETVSEGIVSKKVLTEQLLTLTITIVMGGIAIAAVPVLMVVWCVLGTATVALHVGCVFARCSPLAKYTQKVIELCLFAVMLAVLFVASLYIDRLETLSLTFFLIGDVIYSRELFQYFTWKKRLDINDLFYAEELNQVLEKQASLRHQLINEKSVWRFVAVMIGASVLFYPDTVMDVTGANVAFWLVAKGIHGNPEWVFLKRKALKKEWTQ